MRHRKTILLLALAALPWAAAGAQSPVIGHVKTLSGSATVTAPGDGAARPAALDMALHERDRIDTGRDGQVGITFEDNTRVTLGPNSRLDLAHFVFKPAAMEYGFVLRLTYGTLQYLSGLTAKLAPDAMSIETPGSTIAVRGTRFVARAGS